MGGQPVVGGSLRVADAGGCADVAWRRGERRVRSERGHLQHERLAGRGGRADEGLGFLRQHVRQVVVGPVAVVDLTPVLVQRVVELRIAVPGHIPDIPPGCRRVGRQVAVQILAHHAGLVAVLLEREGKRSLLVEVRVVGVVAAERADVGKNPVVVRVLASEDRRAGRAAERVHYVVVRHRHPGLLHGHHMRHVADQVPGEVVGQDEDEVGPGSRRPCRRRA